jgi:hypothetical protein
VNSDNNPIIPSPDFDIVTIPDLVPKIITRPFSKDIFLFDTHIAGTTYVDDIEKIMEKVSLGDELHFFRETNNRYDNYAIIIKTLDNLKLGYVPASDNVVFARLLDAGKLLIARIATINKLEQWYRIKIKIFLRD